MLKASEREKLQDCLLLVQSARSILTALKPEIIPDIHDIQKCFHDADKTLSRLLHS